MKLNTILATLAISQLLLTFSRAEGPLTPPGAPAPTMKSLQEIWDKIDPRTPISSLPFTITTPGSYYFTGNLTATAGQSGITISADHVTLDLGGFDLAGPESGAATYGIRIERSYATVRNGSVHGWRSTGVSVNSIIEHTVVEDLRVNGNAAGGIPRVMRFCEK